MSKHKLRSDFMFWKKIRENSTAVTRQLHLVYVK